MASFLRFGQRSQANKASTPAPPVRPPVPLAVRFTTKDAVWLARRPSAFVSEGSIVVASRYQDRTAMRTIPHGRYDGRTQTWLYPSRQDIALQIRDAISLGLRESPEFTSIADHASIADRENKKKSSQTRMPVPLTRTPEWAHQRAAFWYLMDDPEGGMLDMYMGTGKSKVFCDVVANRAASRVLLLCPNNVMSVWPKQFKLHCFLDYEIVVLNEGSVSAKAEYARRMIEWCDEQNKRLVLIINYESAWRAPFGPTRNGRGQIIERGFALKQHWDVVGLDESHRIKNPSGKASRFARSLRNVCPFRVCMTGTPMPHSPFDIWAQFDFLDPSIFGQSLTAFKSKVAQLGGYGGYQVKEWINQEWLARQIGRKAFNVGQDVLDLPPTQDIVRTVKLGPKATRTYKELENEFFSVLTSYVDHPDGDEATTVSNVLVKLLRCQQVTSGYVRDDTGRDIQVDTAKQEELHDILEDIPVAWKDGKSVREPVVVFCRFEHDLRTVEGVTNNLGLRYKELSGKRKDLGPDGTYPEDADVFGVQVQSGGVGIDLTRACYAIYYSIDRSLGNYDQTRARVHRPGQTRPTFYYHIVAQNTVDVTIYKALEERREVVQAIAQLIKRDRNGDLVALTGESVNFANLPEKSTEYRELTRA